VKVLGCESNVRYKKPQGTQGNNACPHPPWFMDLIYNAVVK